MVKDKESLRLSVGERTGPVLACAGRGEGGELCMQRRVVC